jgi:hypothetical protein
MRSCSTFEDAVGRRLPRRGLGRPVTCGTGRSIRVVRLVECLGRPVTCGTGRSIRVVRLVECLGATSNLRHWQINTCCTSCGMFAELQCKKEHRPETVPQTCPFPAIFPCFRVCSHCADCNISIILSKEINQAKTAMCVRNIHTAGWLDTEISLLAHQCEV